MFHLVQLKNFSFQNPEFLWLLGLLPILAWLYWWRDVRGRSASIVFSDVKNLEAVKQGFVKNFRHIVIVLRLLGLALLIVAFARPRLENQRQSITADGIDIMMCIDLSGSMQAEDFEPKNRIDAAKQVAETFINNRVSDRIGLVVFAGKSFTQCPLTMDYKVLTKLLREIHTGMIEDGTAIGMAITTATNRLRQSTAKSKVIVLLTDGQNNMGEIEPVTAAELAKAVGIKIYTVGAGTRGFAKYPINDPIFGKRYINMPVDVDDETLERIAKMTGGRYFRATDFESLQKTYKEIDELEKTKIEIKEYTEYDEQFAKFLTPAMLLLALEILLANTRFRKIP
jgi:Ca-activated chloride channel family protein